MDLQNFNAHLRALQAWAYPAACLHCNRPIPSVGEHFCATCTTSWSDAPAATCPRCGSAVGGYSDVSEGCPRCFRERYHFDRVLGLGEYRDELRSAVLRMKAANQEPFAHRFAEWWAGRMRERLAAAGCDCVVPVPIHWTRRWRRGYNQSAFLARALGSQLGRPVYPALARPRRAADQKALSGTERRKNLRDTFRAAGAADLRGRAVLLVDDVLTTGATADACSRVLRASGVGSITVAVVAKG